MAKTFKVEFTLKELNALEWGVAQFTEHDAHLPDYKRKDVRNTYDAQALLQARIHRITERKKFSKQGWGIILERTEEFRIRTISEWEAFQAAVVCQDCGTHLAKDGYCDKCSDAVEEAKKANDD